MNLRKLALCAVAGVMAASMIFAAGCGGDKASDKKVLKVGMECAYAPYNWSQNSADGGAVKIAGSNEYAYGYDVMMAKNCPTPWVLNWKSRKLNGMVLHRLL